MKTTFFAFLLFLFTSKTCSNQVQDSVQSITYETFTRGSATRYEITSGLMQVTSTGVNKSEKSIKLSEQQWAALISNLKEVKVSEINQLKAPSEGRASDAALHAILSIRKNDTIYKTNSFDHGNAPKPIKPLVQAILRLAENVE
ncbi:hypothetical protein [Christiangramia sabulilitoris]|uniref:Uncharacterized protein n=1 Tax=Christiangramia sabulilitoris TaxID=2583991 RepID=A0A550I8B6_9FLAO|nr:hypothetical protein [Christiangramia sabulilitoris]TRO67225.1 hypothetical protein FGM01_04905 [Christiangramia sabulilitoris]